MLLALLLLAASPSAAARVASTFPAFLTGCWNGRTGDKWIQECWMEPRAGLMLGASRTGQGETLESWEWNRIDRAADGSLAYWAAPGGKTATAFKRVSGNATEIVFTNPATDYPQRIRYWRDRDTLHAEISLLDGSKPVRFDYRRDRSAPAK